MYLLLLSSLSLLYLEYPCQLACLVQCYQSFRTYIKDQKSIPSSNFPFICISIIIAVIALKLLYCYYSLQTSLPASSCPRPQSIVHTT